MRLFVIIASCLVFTACTESEPGPTEQSGVDAGAGADAATTADARPPDAAPPTEPQETSIEGDIVNCAQACGELGVGCVAACDGAAGWASYGYFDWDYGITRIVETLTMTTCGESIPSSIEQDGESFDRASTGCCCAVPPVTVVAGPVASPLACSEVCANAGFAGCGDFYDWHVGGANGAELGGVKMTYRRASTGSVGWWIAGCAHVPSATQVSGSVVRDLSEYDCACH